jgi:hypothetical protein
VANAVQIMLGPVMCVEVAIKLRIEVAVVAVVAVIAVVAVTPVAVVAVVAVAAAVVGRGMAVSFLLVLRTLMMCLVCFIFFRFNGLLQYLDLLQYLETIYGCISGDEEAPSGACLSYVRDSALVDVCKTHIFAGLDSKHSEVVSDAPKFGIFFTCVFFRSIGSMEYIMCKYISVPWNLCRLA